MNLNRSLLGGLVGVLAGVPWQALGTTTFFVALGIGSLGFGADWVLAARIPFQLEARSLD